MTIKQKLKIKPILAYAVVKGTTKKVGKNYTTEYKLSAYDIFVDKNVLLGKDEKLIKVQIQAI